MQVFTLKPFKEAIGICKYAPKNVKSNVGNIGDRGKVKRIKIFLYHRSSRLLLQSFTQIVDKRKA